MTSQERVLAALNHVEPDRIPMDLGGHHSSGIAAIAYHRLRKHLGLTEKLLFLRYSAFEFSKSN